jgi:hypothetical protein
MTQQQSFAGRLRPHNRLKKPPPEGVEQEEVDMQPQASNKPAVTARGARRERNMGTTLVLRGAE